MTKNQITYLLALATLAVVWLYFNTFFMVAKAGPRMSFAPTQGRSMLGDWSQRQPVAMPIFQKNQNNSFVNQPSAPAVPVDFQKLMKTQKTQGAVSAEKK